MKDMIRLIIILLLTVFSQSLDSKEIALDKFFKEREFSSLKISPDAKHLAAKVRSARKDILVILDINTLQPVYVFQLDGEQEHIGNYHWLNNERVIFTKSIQKDTDTQPYDSGNIFAANITGKKRNVIFGFNARASKTFKGGVNKGTSGFGRIVNLLEDDPEYISILGYKGTEASPPTLYKVNAYTGNRKRITGLPLPRASIVVNQEGQPVFATGINTFGNYSQYIYKNKEWIDVTNELSLEGDVDLRGYSKTTDEIYLSSFNSDDGQEVLYKFNADKVELKEIYKSTGYDILNIISDPATDKIIGINTMPDTVKTTYLEKENKFSKIHKALTKSFDGQHIDLGTFDKSNKLGIFYLRSDSNIGDYYTINSETFKVDYLVSQKSWLNPGLMSERKPIKYKARDGQVIHGYLTMPKNIDTPVSLITMVHGGPFGPKDMWFYDEHAQVLSNRGYAVLQVNFRGSGGYGANFEAVAYQKQHTLIMDDIIDGTKWAQRLPEINDNNACVYGWSFGGYAASMLSIKGADVFKCSIAAAAPVDLAYQNSNADYSRSKTLKKEIAKVYGDSRKLWDKQSPINFIEEVKLPIFLIHGGKDARVPYEQAEDFKDSLLSAGKEVEWMYKWEEPHGFLKPENKIELYDRIFKFLEKHLD